MSVSVWFIVSFMVRFTAPGIFCTKLVRVRVRFSVSLMVSLPGRVHLGLGLGLLLGFH